MGLGDVLDGGAGFDTANYSAARGSVQLNLNNSAGVVLPPGSVVTQPDIFVSIEKVLGSNFSDLIIGNNPLLASTDLINTMVGGKGGDKMTSSIGNDRYEFAQGDSTAVLFVENGTANLNNGDFFDFTLGNTIPTQIAGYVDNIATQIGITTYAAFGVGTDTIWLHNGAGASLTLAGPINIGQAVDQSYFMVRGDFVGSRFDVNLTGGLDTLVVYDGAAAENSVLQTALVLSGTGGAEFTFLDTNATANSLGATFIL